MTKRSGNAQRLLVGFKKEITIQPKKDSKALIKSDVRETLYVGNTS